MSTPINRQIQDTEVGAPQEEFIARQAILDSKGGIMGYELYAKSQKWGPMDDPFLASARVLIKAFSQFSMEQLLGGKLAFVSFTNSLFDGQSLGLFPAHCTVPEFTITETPTTEFLATLRSLRQQGYRLALDHFQNTPWQEALLPFMDFVKVDIHCVEAFQVQTQIRAIQKVGNNIIVAVGVETQEMARMCYDAGVEFIQGDYFMRPEIVAGKRVGANYLNIFRLLNLLGESTPIAEIELVFQKDLGLSYQLLRYINLVGMTYCGQKIDSIERAIVLMGRLPLQRWLTLLLFADHNEHSSPLLIMAATRGRLAEQLCQKLSTGGDDQKQQAFLVGMLSLLDVMLGIPMVEILSDLHLSPKVNVAILHREGENGAILRLIEAIEQGDSSYIRTLAEPFSLDMTEINFYYLNAMAWAAALDYSA